MILISLSLICSSIFVLLFCLAMQFTLIFNSLKTIFLFVCVCLFVVYTADIESSATHTLSFIYTPGPLLGCLWELDLDAYIQSYEIFLLNIGFTIPH